MSKDVKHDVVIQAVEDMKRRFGLTGIKVELEEQLNRGYECDDCGGDGSWPCDYCDGSGDRECYDCDGMWENALICESCDGEGTTTVRNQEVDCSVCQGSGEVNCDTCEQGMIACEDCDNGRNTCDYCDGQSNDGSFGSETECLLHVLNYVNRKINGAKAAEITLSDLSGREAKDVIKGVKYAFFYDDHSVDSELTFTILVDNPENVFMLPLFIEAWNDLGDKVGGGRDVGGAGMHMALLNSDGALYPVNSGYNVNNKFSNFKRSMSLLLPALFFLGSDGERSRSIGYREPRISNESKYSAIHLGGGALEFRVFDTCYDKPEQILDNVVVMSNCMKFWTEKYKEPSVAKAVKSVMFGLDGNDKVERFYVTSDQIDCLNKGLEVLKPSYYTVRELKAQRNFKRTKTDCKNEVKVKRLEAIENYKEYEERFGFRCQVRKYEHIAMASARIAHNEVPLPENSQEALRQLEAEAEAEAKKLEAEKLPLNVYVKGELDKLNNRPIGRHTLTA